MAPVVVLLFRLSTRIDIYVFITNPLIIQEKGKDDCIVTTKKKHIHGHLWQIYSVAVNQFMSVASSLAAIIHQGNLDRNDKLWNTIYINWKIYSTCRCYWSVATYKWKFHNGKIEMISISITIFMGKSGNETDLTVCVVYRGGFRGGRAGLAPPPLKFAKHMLYNVN